MGQAAFAGVCLLDAVRYGKGTPAAPALESLLELAPELGVARFGLELSRAHAGSEPGRLVEVADDMGRNGYALYAAEALAAASARYAELENHLWAVGLALEVLGYAEDQKVRFPTLAFPDVPLSHREAEIAVLAAQGATSRAIAERLFLSVRTVENHLGHIYRGLGIDGRSDLTTFHRQREPARHGVVPGPV